MLVVSTSMAASFVQAQEYNEAYYKLENLNEGLPDINPPPNLQTPQATLEYFVSTASDSAYLRAAVALNLNLLPNEQQPERGPVLADQLFYLLVQKSLISWELVPDRPDGQLESSPGQENPLAGQPRRSIQLGTIPLDGRDIEVRLQRVKVDDAEPIWVFSPQTVDNIPALYAVYGPTELDRQMPNWAKIQLPGDIPLWQWLILTGLALFGILVGWGVRNLVARGSLGEISIIQWIAEHWLNRELKLSENLWLRGTSQIISGPLAVVIGLLTFYLSVQVLLSLSGSFASLFHTVMVILIIAAITWLIMRIIKFFSDYVGKQFTDDLGSDDEVQARKVLTYISVARRVLIFLALLIGLGFALSQFRGFETFGLSLLASASVVGIIVGIAAQSVLGNIMAGVQVALTQPVRIGDNVYFEGQWGYIEEITYTYITIQTWDQRRVIVPLKYFITHPVQNWSKNSSHLIQPIYLYVDYQTEVDQIRRKFTELLKNDEDWDEETEPTVQVTGMGDETMEVRALCSAKDPSTAWALHCRLREQLVNYVRSLESGRYLPRRRLVLEPEAQNGNGQHEVQAHRTGHQGGDGREGQDTPAQSNQALLQQLLNGNPRS
jgi:small-conductance mechanosensitive channel